MSDPVDWREELFSRRTLGVRLGLDRIRAVDAVLGQPGRGVPVAHVVGTNGKGSTAAMLAHGLSRAGRRVGLYTSPHLHRVGERVRIDGEAVADVRIQTTTTRVVEAERQAGVRLSFFEVITLAGLIAFAEAGVDVIVLEAGLGGRLDATRVRRSTITLVSRIGLDHQRYLGDTLEAVAEEKAAVIHRDAPAWSVAQAPVVVQVLERAARAAGTTLEWAKPLAAAPLAGAHQRDNAGLALAGLRHFVASASASLLEGTRWPGRLESIPCGRGELVFDVAHNVDGVERLVEHFGGDPPAAVVFGCMGDKDVDAMLDALGRLGRPVWWVPPPAEGAMAPPTARGGVPARVFASTEDPALFAARDRILDEGGRVLVCGSHFLVARLRARALQIDPQAIDAAGLHDPVLRK